MTESSTPRGSTQIENLGLYQYDQAVYDYLMQDGQRTRASLLAEVLERAINDDHKGDGVRTLVRRLRKYELAAMVAEWGSDSDGPAANWEGRPVNSAPASGTDPAELAADLSPKHREVITTAWTDGRLLANGNTLRALERRGLCDDPIAYRDGSVSQLTELGRAVHAVLTQHGKDGDEPAVTQSTASGSEPCPPAFDPFWVRNLVDRVGRELHDLDRLANTEDLNVTPWGRGHHAGFERAAEYLTASVRQSVDRLGLTNLLDGSRAGLDVAARSAIPQRATREG